MTDRTGPPVHDIDLSIGTGELVSTTGPSGSGKSSLLYLLALLDRPASGRMLLAGEDTSTLAGEELDQRRLGRRGDRQRQERARDILAYDPPILLADEPTGNLDTKNDRLVFDIVGDLVHQAGKTVVAVTHDPALAHLTDHRIQIVDGHVTGNTGPTPEYTDAAVPRD